MEEKMIDESNVCKTMFGYVDEFGQEIKLEKTFNCESMEDGITMSFLLDEFKLFLLGAGFSPEHVAQIQYED